MPISRRTRNNARALLRKASPPTWSFPPAARSFRTERAAPPILAGAYYNRGNAYYDKKDFPQAIADYNHAILLKPHYPTAIFNRGLAKKRSGDSVGGDADIAASKAMGN
jgi:tetratricopeptide (TPR) repeat protein